MNFELLTSVNSKEALELFNGASMRKEQLYSCLTKEEFDRLFLVPVKEGDRIYAFYGPDRKSFIIGHFDGGIRRFFLTMIQVDPGCRRQRVGTELVNELNRRMDQDAAGMGLPMVEMEISYYNPTMIRWIVPGTEDHYHNNAQGVLLGSTAHLFFKNNGFRDIDHQNSYYQRLDQFVWNDTLLHPYEERVAKAGYTIEFYDAKKHTGLDDLMKDLDNDLWSWQIPNEIHREGGPRPFPILNNNGIMSGFAGPIVVEPTGRAWVLGVAVHSACRGCGAATLLFHTMCNELKKAGAIYFSFFTGESNFARNIYEGAGFRIYASWATMRRLKQKR